MNNTENNQPLSILETAEELFDCGFQVLSVKKDGTKRPAVGTDWPNYQTSAADIEKWYGGKHPRVGMGIITGVRNNAVAAKVRGASTRSLE